MDRYFGGLELTVVVLFFGTGVVRAILFRLRGTGVISADSERTNWQIAIDIVGLLTLVYWFYLVVALDGALPSRFVLDPFEKKLLDGVFAKSIGAGLLLASYLMYVIGLHAMSDSWRIGIDRKTPGGLVTNGVFAWTRNPIYVAFDMLLVGSFLIHGTLTFLLLAVVVLVFIHDQMRREERFLQALYGTKFESYRARVGRYVTFRRRGGED